MTCQNWTWCDDTPEEQRTPEDEAWVSRLAAEAKALYASIPEPVAYDEDDDYRGPEFDSVEEADACYKRR